MNRGQIEAADSIENMTSGGDLERQFLDIVGEAESANGVKPEKVGEES